MEPVRTGRSTTTPGRSSAPLCSDAECEDHLGELLSQSLAERARAFPEVRVAPYREERLR
jgi:hypothetical protein